MRGIEKSFPGVRALRGVDLELGHGEVLALLGENGAGKSTLIKILAGAHRPDAGEIRIAGDDADLTSPKRARDAGIGVIHQELSLVPYLTAAENVFLGNEIGGRWRVDRAAERSAARALFERIGIKVDPDAPCAELGIAERQAVEIAKALASDIRILVMDEPTAALSPREVEGLFTIIGELRDAGIGIIYVSHRLTEILEIADRVMVLRDGSHVGTRPAGDVDQKTLIEMMVGRSLEQEFPPRDRQLGAVRLRVNALRRANAVRDVSFEVRAGEVVAITGLVGAGRTETARLIAGADPLDGGTVEIDGVAVSITNPRAAIGAGICLLTEDRGGQGLALSHSLVHNFGLPNLGRFARRGVVDRRQEAEAFATYVTRLGIKITDARQDAATLSGGNQQKIVLAKWLARDCDVVIIDEPTRGIDVGARHDFYLLINELADAGKAILMISSELAEVIGMADRILVMGDGAIRGTVTDVANTTQEQLLELAIH